MTDLIVGAGGILGALLRYEIGENASGWSYGGFPLPTLLINWAGCFLLGWFFVRIVHYKPVHALVKAGFATGFVGSFTTFSTFSVETIRLFQANEWGMAGVYIGLSLSGGLLFSWLGEKSAARGKRVLPDMANGGRSS